MVQEERPTTAGIFRCLPTLGTQEQDSVPLNKPWRQRMLRAITEESPSHSIFSVLKMLELDKLGFPLALKTQ